MASNSHVSDTKPWGGGRQFTNKRRSISELARVCACHIGNEPPTSDHGDTDDDVEKRQPLIGEWQLDSFVAETADDYYDNFIFLFFI